MIVSDVSKLIFGATISVLLAFAVQGQLHRVTDLFSEFNGFFTLAILIVIAFIVRLMLRKTIEHHEEDNGHNGESKTENGIP